MRAVIVLALLLGVMVELVVRVALLLVLVCSVIGLLVFMVESPKDLANPVLLPLLERELAKPDRS